ncbi:MAG: 16S rRNA (adenine(1518)-N(6)/adenine(1519)-N(6))-dimethyltransferase RsmA [Nitrospirota bacterium]|jgi:16S rRNA (adenine1518-N6/adenine1519-N6)-dimethyltransferase
MGRRLSQHFLYDPSILERIVRVAGISPEDTVVEIGPGPGRLTRALLGKAGRVVAIELDRGLYERLVEELGGEPGLELVRGDVLRYDFSGLGPFKVVANIPYHITTPIIFKLLEYRAQLRSMTLTVQKEVAERITAKPGSKTYGVLSIAVQYQASAKLEFVIPRGAFRPVPKVDSACIHMEVHATPPVKVGDEGLFMKVVRAAFTQRRKTLHNSLKKIAPEIDGVLGAAGIDPGARPETLGLEEFARLSDALTEARAAGYFLKSL